MKFKHGTLLTSFDLLDSCISSVIPVTVQSDYRITLSDPGEDKRALAGEEQIILSVPTEKMEEFMSGLKQLEDMGL